jgi:hypothetical protein
MDNHTPKLTDQEVLPHGSVKFWLNKRFINAHIWR